MFSYPNYGRFCLLPSFVRDALRLMGGQVIITLFSLATVIITARALNTDGRGQFSLALLLVNIVFIFTEFGLGSAGTRLAATGRWPGPTVLGSHAFAIGVRVLVAGCIGFVIIRFAGGSVFPGVPAYYLILGMLQILPFTVAGSILPLLLGLGLAKEYNRLLVTNSLLGFVFLAGGWIFFGLDVRKALLLQLGSSLINALSVWRKTNRAVGGLAWPSLRYLAEAYRFGFGMYISSVLSFANTRIIWLFINNFVGVTGVGLYTVAQTATDRIYLIADALATVLFPRVAKDPLHSSSLITPFVFRLAIAIVGVLALALSFSANWLVHILFTNSFSGSVPIIRLLLVAAVFSSGWRVLAQDFNGQGRSAVTATVNGVATFCGLGLAFLLLPRIGLRGAAWAMLVSTGVTMVAGVWLYGRLGNSGQKSWALFIPTKREYQVISKWISLVKRITFLPLTCGRLESGCGSMETSIKCNAAPFQSCSRHSGGCIGVNLREDNSGVRPNISE